LFTVVQAARPGLQFSPAWSPGRFPPVGWPCRRAAGISTASQRPLSTGP